ncbi:uncharacterized protein LOC122059355 [Macadamia integrifolia]|uniref:uncharacterized protein LOC122059355 n=1 Tax=Macadamia integrifolia TaxID=60698 RepID=UPI001C5279E3|nr:uncharacterized protein LOC122059355 [Macadamia integrifolia]
MKGFLECVPCCGGHAFRLRQTVVPTTPPRRDDTRSFGYGRRRSLNTSNSVSSSSSSSTAAQWQPKLCSISEDKAISTVVEKAEEAARSSKKVSRKNSSRAKIRVRTSYGDDFGRASVPLAIPAFSPTAFLF